MKISLNDAHVKRFMVAVIAMATGFWKIFFFYGAYGEIFFEYIFAIAFVSLSVFVSYFFIEKKNRPFSLFGLALFAVPVLWFLVAYLELSHPNFYISTAGTVLELLLILFSLPYIIYFLLCITHEGTFDIRPRKLLFALVGISVFIAAASFALGKYNRFFLYCRDFKISGMETPLECYSSKEEKVFNGTYE